MTPDEIKLFEEYWEKAKSGAKGIKDKVEKFLGDDKEKDDDAKFESSI